MTSAPMGIPLDRATAITPLLSQAHIANVEEAVVHVPSTWMDEPNVAYRCDDWPEVWTKEVWQKMTIPPWEKLM